ncbi:MAG: signal peptide peptidase SppA [Candidatus Acidiferrales bacterium]
MSWAKRRLMIIVGVIALFVLLIFLMSLPGWIPSKSVLVLDINGAIEEQRAEDFLTYVNGGGPPVLHDYVDAIDTAKDDSRISGIVVRVGPLATGWAKLEEIRAHLLAFRASHKPTICYLGYDGVGNPEYYLASACEKIWLVPTSNLGVRGMMAEALFLRGTFDKLKIVPDYYHIAEYKTASNQFTEKKFTPAHREEVESLLHSIYDRYISEVAEARGMNPAAFSSLVEKGPFLAGEAVENKLVDRLAYWDQVQTFFEQQTKTWQPVDLERYRMEIKNFGSYKIAVVHATGLIVSGNSQNSPGGGFIMGGDSVASDLRRATNDSSIKAIILRVDSGGGSALASEVIRRAVILAKQKKPVVVSMSDVAASGGYWIAMSADKIVADPNTITASIGVLSGKFNLSGLYDLIGLSTDSVATSDNASMYSDQQNFTPAQRDALMKSMQDIYSNFTEDVAEGRKIPLEQVQKIAKGRVWSGDQAKGFGLVDELGGLDRAIAVAKNLAHIPAGESVRIVRFPVEKTFWETFFEKQRSMNAQAAWSDSSSLESSSLQAFVHRLVEFSAAEPVQARMPFDLRIR